MTNPLRTADDYELFIYKMKERFPSVRRSTLTFVRRRSSLVRLADELHFDRGVRLVVRERIVYDRQPAVIDSYGYEVWKGSELKLIPQKVTNMRMPGLNNPCSARKPPASTRLSPGINRPSKAWHSSITIRKIAR